MTASDTGKANALLVQTRLARQREAAGDTRRRSQPVPNAVVQLAEQDLSGQDFSGQNLRRANLYQARLIEARLVGTDLRHANLKFAALRRADLTDADLSSCDLSGADLTGASLLGANLAGAKLDGTVFRRAKLIGLRGDGRTLLDAVGPDRLFGAAHPTTPCLLPYFPSSASLPLRARRTGPLRRILPPPTAGRGAPVVTDASSGMFFDALDTRSTKPRQWGTEASA